MFPNLNALIIGMDYAPEAHSKLHLCICNLLKWSGNPIVFFHRTNMDAVVNELKLCINRWDKACFWTFATLILILISAPVSCSHFKYSCSGFINLIASTATFVGVVYTIGRLVFILGQRLTAWGLKFGLTQDITNNQLIMFSNLNPPPSLMLEYIEANQIADRYDYPVEPEDLEVFTLVDLDMSTMEHPTEGPMWTLPDFRPNYRKQYSPPPPYENPPTYEESSLEIDHL